PHAKPVLVVRRECGMAVDAGPLAGNGRVRMLGRAASRPRLLEQRLVVLLRGLERIRAHDRFARIITVAVSPRRGRRRIVTDQPLTVAAPEILDRGRAVAAEVARIAPELTVLVEILGREDIDLWRLDTFRHRAVAGRADEAVLLAARVLRHVPDPHRRIADASPHRRAGHVVLVEIRNERRSPTDAL